jgi:hypothetical protein
MAGDGRGGFRAMAILLGIVIDRGSEAARGRRRTIMSYLKKDELPSVVAIACRALARDKHLLAAHYVPARKITRPAA